MRLAVLGLLAACGRVGFDARTSGTDGNLPDGAGGAALCDDHIIGDVGEPGTRVRATAVPTGWVVAVDTADYFAFGRVAADGTTGGIYKDLTLSQTYTLYGIGALGDEIGVTVNDTGTAQSYLKKMHPTLDGHDTSFQWDLGIETDPAYALMPSGHGLVACSFTGFLGFKEVDLGSVEGDFISPYSPQGMVTMHMATLGDHYAVLLEMPGHQCDAYEMSSTGLDVNHRMFACTDPMIVSAPAAGMAYAVYDDGAATHLDDIPYTTGTMVSPAYPDHRVSMATATWLASAPGAGTVEVRRMPSPALVASVSGTAFDVVGDELFWVDGTTLHAGRLCLQPN